MAHNNTVSTGIRTALIPRSDQVDRIQNIVKDYSPSFIRRAEAHIRLPGIEMHKNYTSLEKFALEALRETVTRMTVVQRNGVEVRDSEQGSELFFKLKATDELEEAYRAIGETQVDDVWQRNEQRLDSLAKIPSIASGLNLSFPLGRSPKGIDPKRSHRWRNVETSPEITSGRLAVAFAFGD